MSLRLSKVFLLTSLSELFRCSEESQAHGESNPGHCNKRIDPSLAFISTTIIPARLNMVEKVLTRKQNSTTSNT